MFTKVIDILRRFYSMKILVMGLTLHFHEYFTILLDSRISWKLSARVLQYLPLHVQLIVSG